MRVRVQQASPRSPSRRNQREIVGGSARRASRAWPDRFVFLLEFQLTSSIRLPWKTRDAVLVDGMRRDGANRPSVGLIVTRVGSRSATIGAW